MEAKLQELGQEHLLAGITADQKAKLLAQAEELDRQLPGGLAQYVASARGLLEQSQKGINPLAGCVPSVPTGEKLTVDSPQFAEMEKLGTEELAFCGFVLVAGGLGERLGYDGIKVALPLYIVERDKCFLELYLAHISTMQQSHGKGRVLPVAIMTSDDTHSLTLELLKKNNNFGMKEGQITIMKQNKVPAMVDVTAKFSGKNGCIDTKPHGHGDVHTLLQQNVMDAWASSGVKWLVFFQDTNGPIFRAITAVLGVSRSLDLAVNSVCVPRTAGEAVGGICRLKRQDGSEYTINVEYNQLDPLLRSTSEYPNGDVADPATGFSPFPGNINCLVFSMPPYHAVLTQTGGRVPEFVNPKYADASKTVFKSATRLECMMQDLPAMFPREHKVGFTQLERWVCFSPVKNKLEDAAAKASTGLPPESASSAERDMCALNASFLRLAGCSIPHTGVEGTYGGIPLCMPPLVVLLPSFATSLADVKSRFKEGATLRMTGRSSLVLEGHVFFEGTVTIDGALVVKAAAGARVLVGNLTVCNAGWVLEGVEEGAEGSPSSCEFVRMRAYDVVKGETEEHVFMAPGDHLLGT